MRIVHVLLWGLPWLGFLVTGLGVAAEPQSLRVPLFDNLGTLHHPITTSSNEAQQYFDQGLRFVYAFNQEEAIMAFEEAARLDPSAAMAYWGVALASGPNINTAMDKASERRAWDAAQKARLHRTHVSQAEQAYIDAIGKRYTRNTHGRAALDKAYANAMRSVWQQFPNDPDAGVLFAEALMDLRPWDLWTADGKPKPGTQEILSTLESILTRFPNHPGACHYYIHSVEASPTPDRALACAERLPELMPGAAHVVHMPAHIYMRLGRYHEATERNAHAADIDRVYLSKRRLSGDYADGYYTHNLQFLWASLAMEGRRADALKAARQLTRTITEDEARKEKWKEWYLPTPLWSMIRFGQWDELLHEPAPPKSLRVQQGMWRLGRGMAHSASGRLPSAEGEHVVLAGMVKRLGRDRTTEERTERTLLKIAERLLAAELAAYQKQWGEAIKSLEEAIKMEEALAYTEPPFWPIPIRHYLGALLLKAGQPGKAEAVYRADLVKNPRNGWAQFGLMQSLRAQRKNHDADVVEEQWKHAWEHADVTLTASRF